MSLSLLTYLERVGDYLGVQSTKFSLNSKVPRSTRNHFRDLLCPLFYIQQSCVKPNFLNGPVFLE